uniref:Uncharacterized protein n=1 Tax=Leersia perrieri TaxID=77586 RepID=A0A0D9V1G2_9ORYZ
MVVARGEGWRSSNGGYRVVAIGGGFGETELKSSICVRGRGRNGMTLEEEFIGFYRLRMEIIQDPCRDWPLGASASDKP